MKIIMKSMLHASYVPYIITYIHTIYVEDFSSVRTPSKTLRKDLLIWTDNKINTVDLYVDHRY